MKLRVSDRIGIALMAIVGFAFSAFAGYSAYHVWLYRAESVFYPGGINPTWIALIYAVVALLVLILSMRVLMVALRRRERVDKGSVAVQHTDQGNGEVRVSVQALDALVKQAIVGHNEGVADIKTRIVNHEDSVSVKIEMSLNGDVHIPNLTMLLQSSIKNFIEEFSGIAVRDVSIMVTTIIPVSPQLAIPGSTADSGPVVIEEAPVAPSAGEIEQPKESAPAEQESAPVEESPEAEEPAAEADEAGPVFEDTPSEEPAVEAESEEAFSSEEPLSEEAAYGEETVAADSAEEEMEAESEPESSGETADYEDGDTERN